MTGDTRDGTKADAATKAGDGTTAVDAGKPGDAQPHPLGLFEGFGVEVEYMIVDRGSLDVKPIADLLMERVAGAPVPEVERGDLAWSNELVLHVLEIKTNGPARTLTGLSGAFAASVREANEALAEFEAMLLPGGAHPWMEPERETRLWPHEYNEVYRTFDRIFSCRGHGWANLQATHLNLPFEGDEQFRALHSAVRAVLPLLPALAASTPVLEGRPTGVLDQRMVEYRKNSLRIPSVAGRVVPRVVASRAEYEAEILEPIYRDLAPLDPKGALRHEWVNGRGAIARFDRGAVEIRVLDTQECAAAELGVLRAVEAVVRALTRRILDGDELLDRLETDALADVLDRVVTDGEAAELAPGAYLEALGLTGAHARTAGEAWVDLLNAEEHGLGEGTDPEVDVTGRDALRTILVEGPLARRILRRLGPAPPRKAMVEVYRELAGCLHENRLFL